MISKYRNKQVRAFTTYGRGYLHALVNEVWVSEACDPEKISPESVPQGMGCKALWDTGATNTCITHRIAKALGLQPSGKALVAGVHGKKEVSTYYINLSLPNNVGIFGIPATEAEISGADVLIGMDVIRYGDLAISNANKRTIFSFRMPSVGEIDFNKEIEQEMLKTTRNAPGSDALRRERNRRKKGKQTPKTGDSRRWKSKARASAWGYRRTPFSRWDFRKKYSFPSSSVKWRCCISDT